MTNTKWRTAPYLVNAHERESVMSTDPSVSHLWTADKQQQTDRNVIIGIGREKKLFNVAKKNLIWIRRIYPDNPACMYARMRIGSSEKRKKSKQTNDCWQLRKSERRRKKALPADWRTTTDQSDASRGCVKSDSEYDAVMVCRQSRKRRLEQSINSSFTSKKDWRPNMKLKQIDRE